MSQTQGEAEPRLSLDLLAGVREGKDQPNGGYLMEHFESDMKEKEKEDTTSERDTRPSIESRSPALISPSEIRVPGEVGKYSPTEVPPPPPPRPPPQIEEPVTVTETQETECSQQAELSQDLLTGGRSEDLRKIEELKKREQQFIDRINTSKFKILNDEYSTVITACFEELIEQPPPPPSRRDCELEPPRTPTSEKRTGYVFASVPKTILPLLSGGRCVVHSSLLSKPPMDKEIEWNDIDFLKAILVVDKTRQVSYGVCDRNMLHEESRLLAQGKQVVVLDDIDFVDTSIRQLISTTKMPPGEAERQNVIDYVWTRQAIEVYPFDPVSRIIQLPNNYFRRNIEEAQQTRIAAENKEADAKRHKMEAQKRAFTNNKTPVVVKKSLKPEQPEKPAVIDVDDVGPNTPEKNVVIKQEKNTTTTSTKDPVQEVVATSASSTEQILINARMRRTTTSNPLFSPKPDIRFKYPCRSTFHDTYGNPKHHGSPQCPFCATCHWLETLFNDADPYCTWKHEPTVHKIRRSKLSADDKKFAFIKLNTYEKKVMRQEAQAEAREREQAAAEAKRQEDKKLAKQRREQEEAARLAEEEDDETDDDVENEPVIRPDRKRFRRSLIPEDSSDEDIEFIIG